MLWVAQDKSCQDIQIGNEKIVEISKSWYIQNVSLNEDVNTLVITIKKIDSDNLCDE